MRCSSIAFYILAFDGDDLRKQPLHLRKTNLARLLARRRRGYSLASSNRARSARTCFGKPVSSA
jgi:ATP-dependent DNA ligase